MLQPRRARSIVSPIVRRISYSLLMPARHLFAFVTLLFTIPLLAAHKKHTTALAIYTNPILYSDYSDPDVIRDGKHFYLVASSFTFSPGLPILQSDDLVHWTIVAHALPRLTMGPGYDLEDTTLYGKGVWAPAIRKHAGRFFLYFPTLTEGILMTSAPAITGPWTRPITVIDQPNLEDPCPFWDDDGSAYLIHSRKGAGPLILHRMAADGTHVLDDGKEIVNDPIHLHTLEGPKLYKRNGWYYIFAPYGGVSQGSQAVLRSRSLYGPYENRTVLAQGDTDINGPHQGAYIETSDSDSEGSKSDGKGWFLHFQSVGAHGRIVRLEPVRWEEDWPIVGNAAPGQTTGTPVASAPMPVLLTPPSTAHPQTSDDFTSSVLGQQWEWNHNPDDAHWSLTARPGFLRLIPMHASTFLLAHNTLTQQMQDKDFDLTARCDLSAMQDGTHTGLAMLEAGYSGLEITQVNGLRHLGYFHQKETIPGIDIRSTIVELRVSIRGDIASYAYRESGRGDFTPLGPPTPISFSWWKGSRPSLFAWTESATAKDGFIDIDWVHYIRQARHAEGAPFTTKHPAG
jgi:beta-xylosidase